MNATGPDTTELVSISTTRSKGNGASLDAYINGDGRYVTFHSDATNLAPSDTNNFRDVFVHDRQTQTTTLVSASATGVVGNGISQDPAISKDGRYVTFRSQANNLVSGDTNGTAWDIFVKDLQTGAVDRVSVSSAGAQANGASQNPLISADGRYVAYRSSATNLVTGDTNGQPDVFVRDRQGNTTTRVSVATGGTQATGGVSDDPAISDDGRYIAFQSDATNLVTGDTNAKTDVFRHDRQTNTTIRISVSSAGVQSNGVGTDPAFNGDGSRIVWESVATNLVTGDTNGKEDVFVRLIATGETIRVSVSTTGAQATSGSSDPSLSTDGTKVAFYSTATALVSGDTNNRGDVFLRDLTAGTTVRKSLTAGGAQVNEASSGPWLAGDGSACAFNSVGTNLVPEDADATSDIYVRGPSLFSQVEWTPSSVVVSAIRGRSQLAGLSITAFGDVQDATAVVDASIADIVAPLAPSAPFDLLSGTPYEIPIVVDVPAATSLGNHAGQVAIQSSGGQTLGSVSVTVVVSDAPTGGVPAGVTAPSRDRIATDADGDTLIVDELVVGLTIGTQNPDQRILAIAAEYAGNVTGGVPLALTYELRFPVPNLAALASLRQAIESEPDVDFVARSFLTSPLNVIPNDPKWDAWDEEDPSGNNWNMELIRAPSAWDISTGDPSIAVGIIDNQIAPHPDLNIVSDVGVPMQVIEQQFGHGTHVAGVACAIGNNGVGVTGVAWGCSIHAYDLGFAYVPLLPDLEEAKLFDKPLSLLDRMIDAAEDNVRIVNMSVGWGFGECESRPLPELKLDESTNQTARGVQIADLLGHDVLWIAAAGNVNCDARFTTPANLTERFPGNVITVASVERDGTLSDFSTRGDLVSVAAPGGSEDPGSEESIYSTVPPLCNIFGCNNDGYALQHGTSQAAPHVTGLAALVMSEHDFSAAQTKACIVAASRLHGLAIDGQTFHLIEAPSAVLCEATLALPPEVDIVFSLDLTGSMGGEISRVKAEIGQIIDGLRSAAPQTDFRFGVTSYEDYPGSFNSSGCPDSDYTGFYGSAAAGDLPFRINLPVTGDSAAVTAAINGLQLRSGGDGPQSYGRVFWEVAQPDTGAALAFRPSALRLLIDFGDNVPHDADLNAGFPPQVTPPFPSPYDTGYDPGRNATIDCGGDDIDFQSDALAGMSAAGIRLVHVDSSGDSNLHVYWNLWAGQTGGEFAAINADGTIPGGLNLTELIIELLQQVS